MKIRNKKGIQMPIQTVAIFVLVLAALSLMFVYFTTSMGKGGVGFKLFSSEATNQTNESKIIGDIGRASKGGECVGGSPPCGRFYETSDSLTKGGGDFPVSSCSEIGCTPADEWGEVPCYSWGLDKDGDTWPDCRPYFCYIDGSKKYGSGSCSNQLDEYRSRDYTGSGRCAGGSPSGGPKDRPHFGASSDKLCEEFTTQGRDYCEKMGCTWQVYEQ